MCLPALQCQLPVKTGFRRSLVAQREIKSSMVQYVQQEVDTAPNVWQASIAMEERGQSQCGGGLLELPQRASFRLSAGYPCEPLRKARDMTHACRVRR